MSGLGTDRATQLWEAQQKADALFKAADAKNLIRAGVTETQINEDIYALAAEMFGVDTYWHKRIVRTGRNTLEPYDENPPNLTVQNDDIVFIDLGPVFEKWEADFGRTFVVGSDPVRLKLRDDTAAAFAAGKKYFEDNPGITSQQLF